MTFLPAGKLDRRIRLDRFGLVNDRHGDKVEAFSELATVWAWVMPAPGRERLQSAQNAAEAPTVFRIRHWSKVADLNTKDRIHYKGRDYDIKSVNEIGRREGLEIVGVSGTD